MIYYDEKNVVVRDSEESDITALKDHVKEADRLEIWASDHFTPEEALRVSYEVSTTKLTLTLNGEVIGMFGIRPETLLSHRAIVWLITSDKIELIKKTFLKLSKKFIQIMRRDYPILYNYVDKRHTRSVQWIKWAGAEVLPPIRFGVDGLPFHMFIFGGQ